MQGTSSQFPQYYCHTSSKYEPRVQRENMQTQTPAQPVGTLCESKSRRPCSCMKSHCLKGSCECFAGGLMCSNCNCFNCNNNGKHEMEHQKATETGIRCASSCSQNFGHIFKVKSDKDRGSGSVLTMAVVEAVCCSLLVQAQLAESAELSRAQAERIVLQEFSDCLAQITNAMFTDD